jgi:OmpA-OmpF porin, OOP family
MSINLLDMAKQQFGDLLTEKASSMLGEDKGLISKGLAAALPTLLGSVLGHSQKPGGADAMFSLLGDGQHDSLLDNLGGLLGGGPATTKLQEQGGGMITQLLGDKAGGITQLLASFSGLRGGSVSSILQIAAPLLISLISKQAKGGGLNAAGLATMLLGQSGLIKKALPAGMSSLLGISNLLDRADQRPAVKLQPEPPRPVDAPRFDPKTVSTKSNSSFGGLMPWIVAATLLGGILYYWNSCRNVPAEQVVETEVIENNLPVAETPVVDPGSRELPGGVKINFAPTGIESALISFIEDTTATNAALLADKKTWFNFDRLYFNTGKATLTDSSNAQIDNIVAILKAYPTVKLKIGGYTDNTGDPKKNLKLSQERANNTMNAILSRGIEAVRLEAEGYGDQYPEGDNATEEGKAKNRRIAVRVSAK